VENAMSTAVLDRAKALSEVERRTIRMIANGVRLQEVLDELCRSIDVLTPGVVSTVLLMDPDGKGLWPGGGPGFPAVLKPAINPWMIGPGRGACGTAAFLKERVIIADVTTDPRWPEEYRGLAVSHDLRASWSQPLITSAGTVLGTFALYYAQPRVPEAADLELIEAAGQIALVAIQLERSQAALRESEGWCRLVVNTISVMIWTSDADSRWTYLNHAWNEFAGRAGGSQPASIWPGGIHPEDAGRSVDVYTAAFDRRVPFEIEYRLRRHDGVYRWIFDQGVPRFHADGSFAGYIGSGIDITERKLAEQALSMVSRRLIEAQEEERTRLARELHDDINQRLGLVSMCLDRLKVRFSRRRRTPRGARGRQRADRRSRPGHPGAVASPALVKARSPGAHAGRHCPVRGAVRYARGGDRLPGRERRGAPAAGRFVVSVSRPAGGAAERDQAQWCATDPGLAPEWSSRNRTDGDRCGCRL
jgi:PAS domain S-box-containing protein